MTSGVNWKIAIFEKRLQPFGNEELMLLMMRSAPVDSLAVVDFLGAPIAQLDRAAAF
jgi:hypothetical protein